MMLRVLLSRTDVLDMQQNCRLYDVTKAWNVHCYTIEAIVQHELVMCNAGTIEELVSPALVIPK